MSDYDLICLGCGPAGEKAATQASYYGHRAAIVERQARPGGAMVNTGTVPSKALRETALLCSAFQRRPLPGTEFKVDHNVSIQRFMAHRHLIEQQEHDRIESSIDRHNIDVHRGHGHVVDPHTIVVRSGDGTETRITAKHILIATGSRPVRPDHIPFDHPCVVDADEVLALDRLPASMVIVGGGVIGCEYASIFAEIDVDVTLIDPRGEILSFLDGECRDHLIRALGDHGIDLRLNTAVTGVQPRPDGRVRVDCEDGTALSGDVLLWAAGRASNSDGIGLEDVGVELGRRGLVLVDDHYRTNIPSIYAAGDVIGFPALAATSMEQGRVAACHMFDIDFKQKVADTIPIGIYTIPGISMVGLKEDEATGAGRRIAVGRAAYRDNARARMLGDTEGLLKCVFDADTRCLLGATIVGEQATELIHLAQFAIAQGAGIDYFINACFNYPTLNELYKYAAYSALHAMKTNDRAAA
ncbi:MAG: Si-specific NAD(P)(+) transhydrogenase [Phycisphaerales bacterium]|nr:Si-specific NAD(P)(+) transhydrogenase [Phycisphaerae bacterium]NNF45002.1 Si-specific NAD(P)(+) transhydrogenase [Phycisphaerales bacterium]NNM26051.1 Si-specific NAD(P)(+) transhydrogenase [Phycisphaerales bacterium]